MSAATTKAGTAPRRRQPRMPIEVRREQVLDAALHLISEYGYAAASMEAIAREAQLAKPRVYHLYPTRGQLLQAVLEREEQRMIAELAKAMPAFTEDAGFDAILSGAAENLLRAVAAHPVSWRLLMLPAEDAPPEVREHVAAGRGFALGRLHELLVWGTGQRPGLENLDVEIMAHSLLAIGEHAVRLVLTRPGQFTPERFGDFARELLKRFSGLGSDPR